jgi:hypothetical protein
VVQLVTTDPRKTAPSDAPTGPISATLLYHPFATCRIPGTLTGSPEILRVNLRRAIHTMVLAEVAGAGRCVHVALAQHTNGAVVFSGLHALLHKVTHCTISKYLRNSKRRN